MDFDPGNIQEVGIGLSAFTAALLTVFIAMTAWREKVARHMAYVMMSIIVWALFGFLYHTTPDLALARAYRVLSVIGIVAIAVASLDFAYVYLKEFRPLSKWEKLLQWVGVVAAVVFGLFLIGDLFGGRLVVGELLSSPKSALAPAAGVLLAWLIGFYCLVSAFSSIVLAKSARLAEDPVRRRQGQVIFVSVTLGLFLGATRFAPWYGLDFAPLLGGLAVPLFVFAAFYAIKQYGMFDVQVAIAQLLVFTIWTFTFVRALLAPDIQSAVPDILLFIAVLVLGIFLLRSISSERRAEQALVRMTVERAKTEFITIAAHQLRTPLAALRWIFSLLLSGGERSLLPEQQELVEKGSRAADAIHTLANDLLDIERISSGKFQYNIEPGDVRNIARVAIGVFSDAAEAKHIRVVPELPDTLPVANFDRGKLIIVLENLLDNAIKYTPSGGTVIVRVSHKGRIVSIEVIDTGIGISKKDHPRLFEKFFRGEEARKMFTDGSGLGLFVAKTIVDGHKGTLTVFSESAGKGTRVSVELPVQ